MLDAIHDIEHYTAGGRDAFMNERMQQDAVIRKFEIIGEAVKHLSEKTTGRRSDIPWKRIAGMRDRLTPTISASTSRWCGRPSSAMFRSYEQPSRSF
jgi:uncharacterized protein with HEPN domain